MRHFSRFCTPVFSLFVCLALLGNSYAAEPIEVDRVVAVVNNDVITYGELQQRLRQIQRQFKQTGDQLPPDDVLERQLLERLILERAELHRAEEMGLEIEESMLSNSIARIAASNEISLDQLRDSLRAEGVSWDRFRQEIHNELLLNQLRAREVNSRVSVSEAEVDNFIANNPDAFLGKEVLVAQIVLHLPSSPTQADVEAITVKAQEIARRLENGEQFSSVAAAFSDGAEATEGGRLDWRGLEHFPAEIAAALDSLQPGQASPFLRTEAGLNLVKLLDVRSGEEMGAVEVEQTRVRHILLRTSEILSDQDAQSRLLGIRDRVLHGEDFATLARTNSADASAVQGGDIGWTNPGDTVPEFEQAMNDLAEMDVSEPVRSPFGWHLIQVLERRKQDVSSERKRNAVKAALFERKADEAFNDWQRQLRDETYVENKLDDAQ